MADGTYTIEGSQVTIDSDFYDDTGFEHFEISHQGKVITEANYGIRFSVEDNL